MATPTSMYTTNLIQATTGGGHSPRAKHELSLSGPTDPALFRVVRELPPVAGATRQTVLVVSELPSAPLVAPPTRSTSVTSQAGPAVPALPTVPHNTPPVRPNVPPFPREVTAPVCKDGGVRNSTKHSSKRELSTAGHKYEGLHNSDK